jgi:C4-dicarboxylate-specific signal transduction histidine kinase
MQRQDSLRDANQQLAQIDRRVSLGRLVAGVAHDMANPATHIAGSQRIIQMSLQSLDANAEIHAVLEREVEGLTCQLALIEDNSREIVSVNQALTRYSRNSEEALTITLSEMMESIALILKGRLQGVEFDVSVAQAPRAVSRRGQLAQVVVNLLQNAIDSVEKRPDGERKIGVNAKEIQIEEGERCIELIVEDSGRGVPEYLVRNIFRPFVTGGHPGHRMGLGLSTAERIINVRGGSIRVGSSLKLKGASFVVIVPLVDRST